ncbi:MAG TPA: GNAT family N-acetyltransferase [Vicinamibacterales bacterium]|nr:GNAT family N-acetyltransferase [Vicinamibacterales bacterium]
MKNRLLVPADGRVLDRILDATYEIWNEELSRKGYERYYAAQRATAWGRSHLDRVALVEGDAVLASAKRYRMEATLDGESLRVVGLGAIFTAAESRGQGIARDLVERLLDVETAAGSDLALLFSEIGPDYYARLGFTAIEVHDLELRVAEPQRGGAPMTMVRAGEDRDFADLAAIGAVRAAPYRFHLNRDRDLVHHAVSKRRLLAGLGPSGLREVQFVVAEEGGAAVAYVVVMRRDGIWAIEEAGDRDPAGARLGALLQVLIARDPAERRPVIRAALPPRLRPPQVTVIDRRPAAEIMMVRALSDRAAAIRSLREEDLLYWMSDRF